MAEPVWADVTGPLSSNTLSVFRTVVSAAAVGTPNAFPPAKYRNCPKS